jgi:hypothetical protein
VTGIRTTCKNETNTGRVGCGAPYSGNQGHCVLGASWSTHPDGLCHETFGSVNATDLHLPRGVHVDPRTVTDKLHQDDRGVWRGIGDPTYWATKRPSRDQGSPQGATAVQLGQSDTTDDVWAPSTDGTA